MAAAAVIFMFFMLCVIVISCWALLKRPFLRHSGALVTGKALCPAAPTDSQRQPGG
jgi:hypothetical protein